MAQIRGGGLWPVQNRRWALEMVPVGLPISVGGVESSCLPCSQTGTVVLPALIEWGLGVEVLHTRATGGCTDTTWH